MDAEEEEEGVKDDKLGSGLEEMAADEDKEEVNGG